MRIGALLCAAAGVPPPTSSTHTVHTASLTRVRMTEPPCAALVGARDEQGRTGRRWRRLWPRRLGFVKALKRAHEGTLRALTMRAWTVDADDIRVAEDFDEALLHRTPEIDGFLSVERDDKFIVIGTKGFGKTLLLKAKRILYQKKTQAVCLPTSNLLDKPIGAKIFSKETLAFLSGSSLPWSKIWLTAVATTVLKHLQQIGDLRVNPQLTNLIGDAPLRSVIDHFVRLLDFSPSELNRTANDTDAHLVPRLRAINTPVTIFIDGVDEYFNKHIETARGRSSVAGELSPEIWYLAQLGLVEVAYQLRRINHHLKVFAAVRKEAYARLQATVMGQQYRGSAVDIVYPIE